MKVLALILTYCRTLLSKVKWFLINAYKIFRKSSGRKMDSPVVYFNLHSNIYDRYLYQLVSFFEMKGYQVVFDFNFSFVSSWSTSLILDYTETFSFRWSRPTESAISFADFKDNRFHYLLSNNYFAAPVDSFFVPMPMVDSLYSNGAYQRSATLSSNRNRNIKIFFAGNLTAEGYNRKEIKMYFDIPTRLETIRFTQSTFPDRITTPTSVAFWDSYSTHSFDILLVDRKRANVVPELLCNVLSSSNFFLAMPGVVMPLCHNFVEAMCFGCIPILSYAHLCHPELEDGVNCLTYADLSMLAIKIEEALNMEPERLAQMRSNVKEYYEKNLSVEAVVNSFQVNKRDYQVECFLNAEYHSVVKMIPKNVVAV